MQSASVVAFGPSAKLSLIWLPVLGGGAPSILRLRVEGCIVRQWKQERMWDQAVWPPAGTGREAFFKGIRNKLKTLNSGGSETWMRWRGSHLPWSQTPPQSSSLPVFLEMAVGPLSPFSYVA